MIFRLSAPLDGAGRSGYDVNTEGGGGQVLSALAVFVVTTVFFVRQGFFCC